ncbi:MAG: hypothetical protein ACYSVY_16630, partial [Planctomycetota bacterium]
FGQVGVDSSDGEVRLEIKHVCSGGLNDVPSEELLARLVKTAVTLTHDLISLITYVGLVETGVSCAVAHQFIQHIREQQLEADECMYMI